MTAIALIIDDTPGVQRQLQTRLEATGLCRQLLSTRAAQALSLLEGQRIDLIACAWRPQTRTQIGLLLGELQKRESWRDIPLLLFTEGEGEERLTALESGAHDCYVDTTSVAELRARLRRLLHQKERAERLREENLQLARMALTDPLTGLYNRAYFDIALESEAARNQRKGGTFALLMLDVDLFKQVNDEYGHPTGDAVLRQLAGSLQDMVRRSDVVCRYGGEEFALLLPETSEANAYLLAERIRTHLAGLSFPGPLGAFSISVSIGLSTASGPGPIEVLDLLNRADSALYSSKRNGRNCTEIYRRLPQERSFEGGAVFFSQVAGYA
jgi:two-component system, cell cycle response regulator